MPTLEELDGAWPDPGSDATDLVQRCHRLRAVPIADLTPSDLRVLISQGIGVEHLLPRAVDVLEADPLVETSYEPGDLLRAVMALPAAAWAVHGQESARLVDAVVPILDLTDEVRAFVEGTGSA